LQAEAISEIQERILQAVSTKRWGQAEEAWLELMEAETPPTSFHEPIVHKLIRKKDPQHFVRLYEPYLDAMLERGEASHVLELIEFILSEDKNQEWLRPRLVKALRILYSDEFGPQLDQLLARSGLEDHSVSLSVAYQNFNNLVGARTGQVFQHRTWGLGVVKELNMDEEKAVIDFEQKPNQVMTLDGVRNFLRPVPPHHVQASMALEPEELKQRCKKDPASVVRQALKASPRGRLKASDLKKILTTRFLTDNEYKSFWNAARKAIKLDQWIDQAGTGINSELVLRDTPRTFFDEIFQNLVTAKNAPERREVLREVRRHGSDAEMSADDAEALYQLFKKPVDDGRVSSETDQFAHGMLFIEFSDLFEGKENPVDMDALFRSEKVEDSIRALDIPESRRLALERLIDFYPGQWPEMFASVVLSLDPRTAAWMEKEMAGRDHDHERQIALENIVAKPDANPELFIWATKNLFEGNWKRLGESLPPIMLCEELLSLLAELAESFDSEDKDEVARSKNIAQKVRNVLSDNNNKYFKKALAASTVDEARRILQMVRLHDAISHQLKHTFERIILDRHEELRTVSRMEEAEERKKPSYHYVTRGALDRQRSELARIRTQEIPEVTKRIQAAREMGDLRENAEYHAAKEEQKVLAQRAAELEEAIARARLVEAREVTPDTTRFGTRASLRQTETGEEIVYTILGMWEADSEENIISYLTPLGSQLLGKKEGEQFTVTTQDGRTIPYEVLRIESALDPED